MKTPLLAAALCAAAIAAGADEAKTIDLPVYGKCTVVDVVDCTKTDHRFSDCIPRSSSRPRSRRNTFSSRRSARRARPRLTA